MAPLRRRIQIIDENKEFSYKFIRVEYIFKNNVGRIHLDLLRMSVTLEIVTITLSQFWVHRALARVAFWSIFYLLIFTVGTLLNALFGTNFDIMSDERRAQTTHGIWLSKSSGSDILVMDVEGTDGRERAEDQVATVKPSSVM